MERRAFVFGPLVAVAACSTNPEKRIPRAAADAMTGSPWTLTAVSSLTLEGTGKGVDTGGVAFSVTSFQHVINFKKGRSLHRESRDGGPLRAMLLAPPEHLHHPFGFVMAAFAGNSKLGNTRLEGSSEAVDLTIDGVIHTLHIDAQTKLPTRIITQAALVVETGFARYLTIHGYRLPSQIVRKVGGTVAWELDVTSQVASADAVDTESLAMQRHEVAGHEIGGLDCHVGIG